MARDNFTKPVIETLKARVAHRCSNPDCRVPTSAPSTGNKVHTIGVAAHICAASPGGPRYDTEMSTHERKDINNAIWLCQNCSVKIDRDANSFPITLLNNWKEEAERRATSELGKKLPSEEDAVNMLTTALTGLPNNAITNVIRNSHKATSIALEDLDPRFRVDSSYENGTTMFTLHAKENVPISMRIFNTKDNPYDFRKLFEQGQSIEIRSEDLSLEGSRLLEKLAGEVHGSFSFEPNKHKAIHKMWLVNDTTHDFVHLDEIDGSISVGSKYLSFKGSACNGIFEIEYLKSLNVADTKTTMQMSLQITKWDGLNISNLPFFKKLRNFISKIAEGWTVFTSLEIDGNVILKNTGSKYDTNSFIRTISSILEYTENCRVIAEFCEKDIIFSSKISFSQEEFSFLAEAANKMRNVETYDATLLREKPTCKVIADEGCKNIIAIKEGDKPATIRIEQPSGSLAKLFSQEINLPPQVIILESVRPIIKTDIDKIKAGEHVLIEWAPQDNFRSITFYDRSAAPVQLLPASSR
ncbi:hypothetical protein ACV1DN_17535 [Aeromonas allosaccharophila]